MKKIFYMVLSIFMIAVLVIGGLQLWGKDSAKPSDWFKKDEEQMPENVVPAEGDAAALAVDGEGHAMQAGETYAMPKAMAFSSERLVAAIAAGTSVDVKISVTVLPVDAANKTVDFSVDWGVAPSNGMNAVTDYVTVTADSDGSTNATVSCHKAFGSDQIIITVTTRDGGYTDTCTVTFIGKASGISITHSSLTPTSNSGRGSFYELGTGQTYDFNVNLSNIFGSVGSKNLSVKLGGSGSLYFGTRYRAGGGGELVFKDLVKKDMSSIVNKFISAATISGTTLTIQTGAKLMESYYSRSEMQSSITYYYDMYVSGSATGYGDADFEGAKSFNEENLSKCYFTVTVMDSVSGLSQTLKLWLVSGVNGVSFSQNTLMF